MTTTQPAAHQATFAALAVPNFRRYVSGRSLSLIGTWVETVAQALLVLKLTHSGTILGLTTAARYAPILLLSPHAGLLVDRHAKRPPSSSRNSSAGASVNSSPPWGGPQGRRQASRNGPASAHPAPCAAPQAVRVPGRHRA